MNGLVDRALRAISLGTVSVVDDSQTLQQLQVKDALVGPDGSPQVTDNVAAVGQFGLASNPPIGSRVLRVRVSGSHNLSTAIGTVNEASRPKNLKPGDSQLYDVRGQSVALSAQGITVTGKGGALSVSGVSGVSLNANTAVAGTVAATGNVSSAAAVTAAGDVTAGAGIASLLAIAGLVAGLLTSSAAQASEITTLQQQAASAASTATALAGTQTQVAQNTTAIAQAQANYTAAEAQVTALLAQVTTINGQIADLTGIAFDPAAQAASLLASQTAQAAAEAARDAAVVSADGASVAASGAANSQTAAAASASAANASFLQAQTQAGTATNEAGIATSQAAAATASAAAAQQSSSLAASAGSGAMNANPTFAQYAGTGSLPTGWQDDGNAVAAGVMVAGFDSSNAIQFDCTSTFAGLRVGISQQPTTSGASYGLGYAGPGWYVLEVDVYVTSQTNAGSAAAYLDAYPSALGAGTATSPFSVFIGSTPDINGQSGIITGRRQYAVLGQVTSAKSLGVGVLTNGAGGVYSASNITWHKVLLRPASSAEIAGQQALTTANANTASITANQSAQASQNTSFANSISSLNAAVFTASGGSLQSQITSLAQTQATQTSTFASQITTLQAQVSINPNLCPNGGFANGFTGWSGVASSGAFVYQDGNFGTLAVQTAWTGGTVVWSSPSIPIVGGQTYTLSGNLMCGANSGGAYYQCYLDRIYYNSSGTEVLDGAQTYITSYLSVSGPNYKYTEAAPSAATSLLVRAVFYPPAGTAVNCYAQRVKLEVGSVFSGWSDDTSAVSIAASVTANSTAIATLGGQLYSTYTLTATAGNVVTGMQLLSASGAQTVSAVIFQAENFIIKSASASAGVAPFAFNSTTGTLTLQNVVAASLSAISANLGTVTAGQIMFNNSSTMLVLGNPAFGSANQFVMWFGPSMAVSSCTQANAEFYLMTNGSSYFAGSLSAGTLTSKGATSDTSATANCETGAFGSNGGTITVTLSYTYSGQTSASYANLASFNAAKSADGNTFTNEGNGEFEASGQDGPYQVALYRSINGGAAAQVATLSVNGSWTDIYDNAGDSWSSIQQSGAGGSLTYTDPQQIAQNRQYSAALVSRSPKYQGSISQNISIICVEQ